MESKTYNNDQSLRLDTQSDELYTHRARHARQADTLRRSAAEAAVGPHNGEEVVDVSRAVVEARSAEEACLVVPCVAEGRSNRPIADRAEGTAGAIVLGLVLTLGRGGIGSNSSERDEEERCGDHVGSCGGE